MKASPTAIRVGSSMLADKPLAVAAACAVVAAMAVAAYLAAGGSKTGIAFAIVAVTAPVTIYLAITRPLLFPLALFALLVPFDNILYLSNFGTLTKLLGALSAIAIFFSVLRSRNAIKPSLAALSWALLILWMGASLWWAGDIAIAETRFITVFGLYAMYLAVSMFPVRAQDLRILLGATMWGGIAAAGYSVYLFVHGKDIIASRLFIQAEGSNIDPNHFAAALLVPLSLTLITFLGLKWSAKKLGMLAFVGLLIAGIYLSGSRGSVLALSTMVLYMLVRSRYRVQLIAIAVLGFLGSLPTALWARFGQAAPTGGAGRTSIWKVGVEAFKSHWLTGAGFGNFPDAYDRAYIHVYQSYMRVWHMPAHDLILQVAVELGIVGLVLLLAAWYRQLTSLNFVARREPMFDLRIALEASVVALFVASIFLDLFWYKYLWLGFILIAASRNVAQPSPTPRSDLGATSLPSHGF